MHETESVKENLTHKILLDFDIQIDRPIIDRRPNLVLIEKKKKNKKQTSKKEKTNKYKNKIKCKTKNEKRKKDPPTQFCRSG